MFNNNAECSDLSCPCHEWSAKSPSVTYYGHPRLDTGLDYPVSEAKNVLSGDSEPSSPILTIEQALAELREMFPHEDCFQVTETAWSWKESGNKTERNATILVGIKFQKFSAPTLTEAMEQVRKWHKEQQ